MTEDLTTQILERKVLDRILQSSTIVDDVVASDEPEARVETLDHTADAGTDEPPTPEATADAAGTETPAES